MKISRIIMLAAGMLVAGVLGAVVWVNASNSTTKPVDPKTSSSVASKATTTSESSSSAKSVSIDISSSSSQLVATTTSEASAPATETSSSAPASTVSTTVTNATSQQALNRVIARAAGDATVDPYATFYITSSVDNVYQIEARATNPNDPEVSNLQAIYRYDATTDKITKMDMVSGEFIPF